MGMFDFLTGKQDKEPYRGETLDGKPLYNLSEKESKFLSKSRFLFLGSYGKKDKNTFNNVVQAIEELGYNDEVIFIKNNSEILKFGIIDTPALVVDGQVVTYGKQLEIKEVKDLFEKYNL